MDCTLDLYSNSSELVDQALGYEVSSIEELLLKEALIHNPGGTLETLGHGIHGGNQTWIGLSPKTLQTPYSELKRMCELLKPTQGELFVDLGAGYGRMGVVLKDLYPMVSFLGFEYVPERVKDGNRIFEKMGCDKARLVQQDLKAENFVLPEAEYYLIYDYGNVIHIRKTLQQLEQMAEKKEFRVIGRGEGTRSLIQYEHPWLCSLYNPVHEKNYSIYSFGTSFSNLC